MGHYYTFEAPEEMVRRYLDSGGLACPFCGSKNIDGIDHDYLETEVECLDCGNSWLEIQEVVGLMLDEEAENVRGDRHPYMD